jgi:hypothetical protein
MNILQQLELHAALQDDTQLALGICLTVIAVTALCLAVQTTFRPAMRAGLAQYLRVDYWTGRARRRGWRRGH